MNPVPEKLINYMAYLEGYQLVGAAEVTLPNIKMMAEKIEGAGLAGVYESPTIGHTDSIQVKIKWRLPYDSALELAKPGAHLLDFRGAGQIYDAATGTYAAVPIQVIVKGACKSLDLGKFAMGKPTETVTEIEAAYLKITVDGEDKVEVDKFNYVYLVDGTDYLADVRSALGLGG